MVTRYYYWITTQNESQPILLYGGLTESEAREKGLEMLSGTDFQIKRLPTRDIGAASAYIRGKRLEATHDIHESTRRIGHERTVRRFKHRGESAWS